MVKISHLHPSREELHYMLRFPDGSTDDFHPGISKIYPITGKRHATKGFVTDR